MSQHLSQLQQIYEWTPNYRLVLKKLAPQVPNLLKIPQSSGISGWICLLYNNLNPICLWVTNNDSYEIPICLDERLYGDTIFKAEKINNTILLSDIYILNCTNIFRSTTYKQRSELISEILSRFYTEIKGFPQIISKSKYDFAGKKLKGYELYTDELGSKGYFVENTKTKIIRSDIPDVYFINGTDNYLRVPDLKTSEYLRSKEKEFELEVEDMGDGTFIIKENIL